MTDWNREAELDLALDFDGPRPPPDEPKVILLTGATGFLGANLLAQLVRKTRARVICLIRAGSPEAGLERLRAQLDGLQLGLDASSERVSVVAGDLTAPRLGLSARSYAALAQSVDQIFHIGAAIHFLRPYASLRAANVGGTEAVLRLAAATRLKPLHHVSSLAVFFGQGRERVSEQDHAEIEGLRTGYAQSKWVAEQLVLAAGRRGLPVALYRTARISADSRSGATSSWNDLVGRLIKACVLLRAYPRMDIEVALTPVDYVTEALVHISQQQPWGHNYHLFNSRPIPWSTLIGDVRSCGYSMEALAYEDWLAALKRAAASPSRPEREALGRLWMALATGRALRAPRPSYAVPHSGPVLDKAGIRCPMIDRTITATSVDFMVKAGYLPEPDERH